MEVVEVGYLILEAIAQFRLILERLGGRAANFVLRRTLLCVESRERFEWRTLTSQQEWIYMGESTLRRTY